MEFAEMKALLHEGGIDAPTLEQGSWGITQWTEDGKGGISAVASNFLMRDSSSSGAYLEISIKRGRSAVSWQVHGCTILDPLNPKEIIVNLEGHSGSYRSARESAITMLDAEVHRLKLNLGEARSMVDAFNVAGGREYDIGQV